MTPLRVVLDTNVYVSRYLRPESVPGHAVARAWTETHALISGPALRELHEVLNRPKFARYIKGTTLEVFVRRVSRSSETVQIPFPIRACRDPRDDKFLEIAVHGRADLIITGDADLLALNPFQGVEIVTPASFLARDLRRE